MPRLLFKKTGPSVWISHLDLMRLFQRAFKRAGLHLTHTQGFNPRPSVSIALPLSVGTASICELLDFALTDEEITFAEIKDRLNRALVEGIEVLNVYADGAKIRDLAYLQCNIDLIYDKPIDDNAINSLVHLFSQDELIVIKNSKNGAKEQNIIPMIRKIEFFEEGEKEITIQALICCQNPTLNPVQIVQAIHDHLPELSPDHAVYHRIEIYDKNEDLFR